MEVRNGLVLIRMPPQGTFLGLKQNTPWSSRGKGLEKRLKIYKLYNQMGPLEVEFSNVSCSWGLVSHEEWGKTAIMACIHTPAGWSASKTLEDWWKKVEVGGSLWGAQRWLGH